MEPALPDDGSFYVISDGPRAPFEIGRLSGMPRMVQEPDFSTSRLLYKIEHAFGAGVADHRVIIRCKAS